MALPHPRRRSALRDDLDLAGGMDLPAEYSEDDAAALVDTWVRDHGYTLSTDTYGPRVTAADESWSFALQIFTLSSDEGELPTVRVITHTCTRG